MSQFARLLFLLSGVLSLLACSEESPTLVTVDDDDPDIRAAMEEARATIPSFVNALAEASPSRWGFAVKKGFVTSDNSNLEFIWLNDVTMRRNAFEASVNNIPVDVPDLELGDRLTVPREDVADWMYIEDGELVGGYTLRVVYFRETPEKQMELARAWGVVIRR